jgi:hypothetical protein
MSADTRDLRDLLKAELEFIEKGGYRKLSWRPQFVFEDSPTCLNYKDPNRSRPCSECPLMKFVPEKSRGSNIPCRHIPLNERGETVASLYHWATQEELEAAVVTWLKKTIRQLGEAKSQQSTEHKETNTQKQMVA